MADIYSREGAGAFFGLVAIGVAGGLSIDDAAAKAHEVWSREISARGARAHFSVDDLKELAREVGG